VADASDFVFPEPWWDLRAREARDAEMAELLAQRLGTETAEGHPLFAAAVTTVARCTACDDVLYDLGDSRFAVVHLTWTDAAPDSPPWPKSTVYASWEDAEKAILAHEPDWE
jgi:hypothetical protein